MKGKKPEAQNRRKAWGARKGKRDFDIKRRGYGGTS
jgi:hypothetical protein